MKIAFRWIAAVCIAASFVACNDDDAGLPPGVIDPDDLLNATFSDTATIIARIEADDTLRTDLANRAVLGNMNDVVMGYVSAGFYVRPRVGQKVSDFGINPQLDSVVLAIVPSRVYGNYKKYGGLMTVKVFEMTDTLQKFASGDTTFGGYNSHTTNYTTYPNPIGSKIFVPIFPSFKGVPQLRIRLSDQLGQRFLDADSLTSGNLYNILKGIYVTAADPALSPNEGSILSLNLLTEQTRLSIYFTDNDGEKRELFLQLGGSGTAMFNTFEHDYPNGGEVENKLAMGSLFDYATAPRLMIQSLEGVRIKFKLPYIADYLAGQKLAVNKAEIYLPIDATQDLDVYPLPAFLNAYTVDAEGKITFVKDFVFTYYDGEYDSEQKAYKLVLSQHVQDILNGVTTNDWIYIDVPVGAKVTELNRAVFMGPKDPVNPMKLNFVYTKIQAQ